MGGTVTIEKLQDILRCAIQEAKIRLNDRMAGDTVLIDPADAEFLYHALIELRGLRVEVDRLNEAVRAHRNLIFEIRDITNRILMF